VRHGLDLYPAFDSGTELHWLKLLTSSIDHMAVGAFRCKASRQADWTPSKHGPDVIVRMNLEPVFYVDGSFQAYAKAAAVLELRHVSYLQPTRQCTTLQSRRRLLLQPIAEIPEYSHR